MISNWTAIAIDPSDNVAVLLRDVVPGETVVVRVDGRNEDIVALEPMSLGHKIARCDVPIGASILKYGESIGSATGVIEKGRHVHVHNLVSNRAKKERK